MTIITIIVIFFFLWARRHSLRMHRSLRLVVLNIIVIVEYLYIREKMEEKFLHFSVINF
jgi:hypothetical protein